MKRRFAIVVALCLYNILFGGSLMAAEFVDPLDSPSVKTLRAASTRLTAAALNGGRLIAVGKMGRIVISADKGLTWTQAEVPLSADLVAINFINNSSIGWTCGHYGALLRTNDGGKHWRRIMDGRSAEKLIKTYYQHRLSAGDKSASRHLHEAELNYKEGASYPLLSVNFANEHSGLVVGAFGTILATTDGGDTWMPWMDRVDNPESLHLNDIIRVNGKIYLASERGTIFSFDSSSQRFVPSSTGYSGTFFGVVGGGNVVIAFGMRGNIYRSADEGRTWRNIPSVTKTNIVAGTYLPNDTFVLAAQGGELLVSRDGGETFTIRRGPSGSPLAGVMGIDSRHVLLVGERGVRVEVLK